MKSTPNDEVIQAVFTASEEAKAEALAILRGEASSATHTGSPLLLNMGDAAELLNVSRATLWRMIRAGRLRKVEIYPGAYRLRKRDLLKLVNGQDVNHAD